MGQYYRAVNLDKKQYIKPHDFDEGAKLMEFASSACGMLRALAVLLADGNGRGGGDLRSEDAFVGSWAGDRIVIAGDYGDAGKFTNGEKDEDGIRSLYDVTNDWENVSDRIKAVLRDAGE